jgi:hypothetical protein
MEEANNQTKLNPQKQTSRPKVSRLASAFQLAVSRTFGKIAFPMEYCVASKAVVVDCTLRTRSSDTSLRNTVGASLAVAQVIIAVQRVEKEKRRVEDHSSKNNNRQSEIMKLLLVGS